MAYGTINADLMTTSDGVSSSGLYGFKNRIINGAMVINQRGTSVTASSGNSGVYITDRFREVVTAGTGVFTVAQDNSAPVGFINSLKATVTTAYSVTTTDRYEISQLVEGYNIYDLAWGSANAKTVTLSFWVQSSLTGTFGGVVQNANADYNYPFTYTISSANTWTQVSITIAGPTSGTWATDNTQGLKVTWSLGCGSTRLGTAGSWSSTRYEGATGQTQVIATNSATWYITSVQLEKGSTATSFDYRPYGTDLMLCQRYYQNLWFENLPMIRETGTGLGAAQANIPYVCQTRTTPTIAFPSYSSVTGAPTGVTGSSYSVATNSVRAYSTNSVNAGAVYNLSCNMTVSAEL